MLTRKRVILSAMQKRKICEKKKKNPSFSNVELAQEYKVEKSTVTNILKEKERWFTISVSQENIKKFHASHFAKQFSIEDFYYSEGWLGGFKKRYGLRQFKKQSEAASTPSAESIKNDCRALQQLLTPYNSEDIWNGDETGLFWKMEPSRVLACTSISGHKKEKSRVMIFCAANALQKLGVLRRHRFDIDSRYSRYRN
ncbi:tigger transposable element-derived protein 6-like [Rhizophagus clarus]|uniref:Tigger transposable element-derived protein 6-like n=1 Tax=Rhizophagus clarus TaxID=94130 RepID=A0A8H3LW77_9GLOM|nr:tigger transposable element-derived protein 6-like [Rhizophagus clarus]